MNIKREHFNCLDSTQNYAKEKRSDGRNLIVTATRQEGGRGTKGRNFVSEEGGVYLSKLSFYEEYPTKNAFRIMCGAAVSVCNVLRFYGLNPCIKWPNDVLVDDRKICGILIENVFSGQKIASSVVGIGLNVYNALSDELKSIATTMYEQTGKRFSVEEVTQRLIAELDVAHSMDEYRKFIGYMGREVTLILGDEHVHGILVSIDDEGGLLVEINGKTRRLTAAEVSIRI
jgi:BirA family biotin operon repressor/biotin-[acetyl-CoA-carboxylase] ligase